MKQDIFNKYVERICKRFSITPEQLFNKTKKANIVDARHLLYYVCLHRPMKVITVQEYMEENGYKINHSSVLYGIKSITDKITHDKDYKKVIDDIEQSI
jgi:chromosomal replication initiation ATPase DnaA